MVATAEDVGAVLMQAVGGEGALHLLRIPASEKPVAPVHPEFTPEMVWESTPGALDGTPAPQQLDQNHRRAGA
jgi:hypothetical protein